MRGKFIAAGIVSPLILGGCAVGIVLVGLVSWLWLQPDQQARIIRIVPVGPLTSPQTTAETQHNQFQSPVSQGSSDAAVPQSPPQVNPVSEDQVAQTLGFSLPPGSVNSVTQQGVATRLVIPKLNLDAPVVIAPIKDQTWQVDHLGQAVGHLEGTAPPGSDSNIVLAGHVTLSASVYGPFAGLGQLTSGDEVLVYAGDQAFQYIIDGYQTVDRTAVDVTYPTTTGQLTLITCNNWSGTEGRYLQRLIVKAHLIKN
ncbi:MAG: sortase [Anaerolineae bacterium]